MARATTVPHMSAWSEPVCKRRTKNGARCRRPAADWPQSPGHPERTVACWEHLSEPEREACVAARGGAGPFAWAKQQRNAASEVIPAHVEQAREQWPNAFKPWTRTNDAVVQRLWKGHWTVKQIADRLGRSPVAIRSRLEGFGFTMSSVHNPVPHGSEPAPSRGEPLLLDGDTEDDFGPLDSSSRTTQLESFQVIDRSVFDPETSPADERDGEFGKAFKQA